MRLLAFASFLAALRYSQLFLRCCCNIDDNGNESRDVSQAALTRAADCEAFGWSSAVVDPFAALALLGAIASPNLLVGCALLDVSIEVRVTYRLCERVNC